MQRRLLAAGVFLVLVAFALPGQGYHIEEDPVNDQNGLDPQEWTGWPGAFSTDDPFHKDGTACTTLGTVRGPLLDELSPCRGSRVTAGDGHGHFAVCEQPHGLTPGHSGIGGLCYMSPGFTGSSCAFDPSDNQGNSNGVDDGCSRPIWSGLTREWYRIQMRIDQPFPYPVPFVADIGGHGCGVASMQVVYDAVYADYVSSGHVEGYPTVAPAVGTYGSYTVEKYAGDPFTDASLHPCGPFPMFV